MVDKLKLSCEVMVSHRCRIRFSIRKFEDEAYFDVLPMDACHLLLGRPWQFDRHTQHDGRKNIFLLSRMG